MRANQRVTFSRFSCSSRNAIALALLASASTAVVFQSSARAASGSWSNNAGGIWSVTGNWSGGIIADGSGSTATFGGLGNNIAGVTTVSLDSDRTLTNLSFTDDAPASPGSWILNNNGAATNNLILAGTTPTITVSASSPLTISAIIEGTAGLTKQGSGILNLSNANTFTGGVVMGLDSNASGDTSNGVNSGIIAVTNATALGTSAITINGRFQNQGKLQLSNDVAITTAGNITFTNSRQAIGALGGGGTGAVGGAGSNALGYANIENLSGNNSLNSNMTIANGGGNGVNILSLAGTLTLAGNLSSGGTITSNRTYSFAGAGHTIVSGVITNGIAGISVTKENAGTLTLTNVNTYVNATTIAGGTISVSTINNGGVAGNLGASSATSSNLIFSNGTLKHTGASENINRAFTILAGTTATIDTTNSLLMAGANGAATTGALTKIGNGTFGITGTNTYTGTTTISAGTLQLGDTGATGTLSPSSAIVNNGTLTIAHSNAMTQGTHFSTAPITGTGGLTQFGTGTTTLNAANTYAGLTAINAGTLAVSGGSAIVNTGAVFIANVPGATFQLNASETIGSLDGGGVAGGTVALGANTLTVAGTNATTFAGTIAGATGSLVKQGTGSLSLSGTNSYTGTTTVSAGTLTLATTGSITSNTSVSANATLLVDGVLTGTVLVADDATLRGDGKITGTTTLNGDLKPGTLANGTFASLELAGGLSMGPTATTLLEADASSLDQVNVSGGSFAYDGTLAIDLASAAAVPGSSFNFFDFANSPTGNFTSVDIKINGSAIGALVFGGGYWTGVLGGTTYSFDGFASGSGGGVLSLSLSAVPEPLTAGGVLLLATRVLGRRGRASL